MPAAEQTAIQVDPHLESRVATQQYFDLLHGLREAHDILQRLYVAHGVRCPNNVFMAMTHLHIEIIARSTPAAVAACKEVACAPGN